MVKAEQQHGCMAEKRGNSTSASGYTLLEEPFDRWAPVEGPFAEPSAKGQDEVAAATTPPPGEQDRGGQKDAWLTMAETDDVVGLYLQQASKLPLLSKEQEVKLAIRIELGKLARHTLSTDELSEDDLRTTFQQIKKGQEALNLLIQSNTRLVISIAKRFQNRGLPLADLIQAGNIGLIRAAKKFDYRLGYKFSTYATWWIRQSVSRSVINHGRTIRVPAHRIDSLTKIQRIRHRLLQKLDRDPTHEEISIETGIPPAKVAQILRLTRHPISLELPILDGEAELGDLIEDHDSTDPEDTVVNILFREEMLSIIEDYLPAREARIVRLRFGLKNGNPLTLQEVGEKEGITRERVRQIVARGIRRLRTPPVRQKLIAYLERER